MLPGHLTKCSCYLRIKIGSHLLYWAVFPCFLHHKSWLWPALDTSACSLVNYCNWSEIAPGAGRLPLKLPSWNNTIRTTIIYPIEKKQYTINLYSFIQKECFSPLQLNVWKWGYVHVFCLKWGKIFIVGITFLPSTPSHKGQVQQ